MLSFAVEIILKYLFLQRNEKTNEQIHITGVESIRYLLFLKRSLNNMSFTEICILGIN